MAEFHGNQHTTNDYDEYSYEQLVEDTRELASDLDRVPTTRDAMYDEQLPCLRRIYKIADDGWLGVLRDAGLKPTQVESYDSEDRDEMLNDLQEVQTETTGDRLTTREYASLGTFSTSTIKKTFGSWAEACEEAGITSGSRHGTPHQGPNGEQLASRHEWLVARWLSDRGIEYVPHPSVGETGWECDFYLPAWDLWVEVDGYANSERPNAKTFDEKLQYYETHDVEYVVVADIGALEDKLLELGAPSEF